MSAITYYKQFPTLTLVEGLAVENENQWALSRLTTLEPDEVSGVPSLIERLVELETVSARESKILETIVRRIGLRESLDGPYENEASIWHFAAKNRYISTLRILTSLGNLKGRNALDAARYFPLNYLLDYPDDARRLLESDQPLKDIELAHIWG